MSINKNPWKQENIFKERNNLLLILKRLKTQRGLRCENGAKSVNQMRRVWESKKEIFRCFALSQSKREKKKRKAGKQSVSFQWYMGCDSTMMMMMRCGVGSVRLIFVGMEKILICVFAQRFSGVLVSLKNRQIHSLVSSPFTRLPMENLSQL